jgi:hypothetical protein
MSKSIKKYLITVYFNTESKKETLEVQSFGFNKVDAIQHFLFKYADQLNGFLLYVIEEVK